MRDDNDEAAVQPGGLNVGRANKRLARISAIMTTKPQVAANKKISGVASSRDNRRAVRVAHWNMARLTKSQIQIVDDMD
jgi:hypothetical protein